MPDELRTQIDSFVTIKVVGIGGGGSNALSQMVRAGVRGVEFVALNTDTQALQRTLADRHLVLGEGLTKGLGAGGNPEVGAEAAEASAEQIHAAVCDAEMVFITAGMGGGTGSGAAPVAARIARQTGALTVGVVTRPFRFEGTRRQKVAAEAIEKLREHVDSLIVVSNDRVLQVIDRNTSVQDAFSMVDDVVRQGVQGISELITVPGLINLDFADVRTIMANSGPALLGMGVGRGASRAIEAAKRATTSPLLEHPFVGARGVIFNVVGGSDLALFEVHDIAQEISRAAAPDANIIFGAVTNPHLRDELRITVIATGLSEQAAVTRAVEKVLASTPASASEPTPLPFARENVDPLDVPPYVRRARGAPSVVDEPSDDDQIVAIGRFGGNRPRVS